MALHRLLFPGIFSKIYRSAIYLQNNFKQSSSDNSATVDLEDVIDNFTIELLQKKKDIWDMRNEKLQSMKLHLKNKHCTINSDVQSLSREQLDEVFNRSLVDCNDEAVIALLKECSKVKICPSHDFILQVMRVCAQNGEVDLIETLEELCRQENIYLPNNFNFEIYKAHAVWVKGHVIKAIDLLYDLYMTNPFLRRNIRMTLRRLISTEVKNNSEAVLIYMLKIAKSFIECHKDYFFLICICENCFLSDLYSDQQLALSLLHEDRKLVQLLTDRLPFLLNTALRHHKTEAVYKLLECFFVMEMKEQCTIVAMAFLDYHFLQVNLGNYSEIIRWCNESDISLPSIYQQKYLNLLLKFKNYDKTSANKSKVYKRNRENDLCF